MSTVRLNYDGWLALPATVRQRLGLTTGDRLDLELVDGAITLRPRRADALPERSTAEPVATGAPELPAGTAPVRKGATARPGKSPLPVIPPALKARGGKRRDVPVTVR
jgi:AbrB family looped-hinge helix DNA binding protein